MQMATVRKEMTISAPAETAWAAIRDVGAVHRRLAKGFVVDTRLDGGARIVTFANGMVLRELIVTVDDESFRLVWAAVSPQIAHHNGALQVFAEPSGGARIVWTADLLPDERAPIVDGMMAQGMAAMMRTLEGSKA
jgi:hypothetical protein